MKSYKRKNGVEVNSELYANNFTIAVSHPDKIKLKKIEDTVYNLIKHIGECEIIEPEVKE